MRGKTLGATLRVDAPAFAEPAGFARSMVDYLALDTQATAVLLAIYTASTPAARTAPSLPRPRRGRHRGAGQCRDPAAGRVAGHPVALAKPAVRQRRRCCPPESLESITDGQLNAELVFRGSSYEKTPGTSYAPFAGPADREEQIRHALPGVLGAELLRAGNCGQRP